MLIQTIDLAAIAWASALGDGGKSVGGGKFFEEYCAIDFPDEDQAVMKLTEHFTRETVPDIMIVEDQPHGIRWDTIAKNVARMQGRLIERMSIYGYRDRMLFLQPVVWQTALGVWRKSPAEVAAVAASLGYTPPNLVLLYKYTYENLHGAERSKVRERLKKLMTDHIDAFLIYCWAIQKHKQDGVWDDIKGAQRYTR